VLNFFTSHAAVRLENTRWSKFTELMTNHILGNVNSREYFAVVNAKRVADKIRRYRRAAGPSLDRLLGAGLYSLLDLLEEVIVDKETFFDGTCHGAKKLGLYTIGHAASGRCGER